MILHPFKAWRCLPASAQKVGSVPYDVVNATEARVLAEGNSLSFLHVSRSEIDFPENQDAYHPMVYEKAASNWSRLCREGHMVQESQPMLYVYRMTMGGHVQTGILGCFSIDEYESGVIKRHELTRQDKEDDRTRHILATGIQSGPALLTYRDYPAIEQLLQPVVHQLPLLACRSEAGVLHEIWPMANTKQFVAAFREIPVAYIADGHHRTASAARARTARKIPDSRPRHSVEHDYFLAAIFPESQMKILAYNRVVTDLNGHSSQKFLQLASEKFAVERSGPSIPLQPRQFSIYLEGQWRTLTIRSNWVDDKDPVKSLDSSLVHEHLITPILGIVDVRTDKRIGFVGGSRGSEELERLVQSGQAAVAFSLYPTSVKQMFAIADANQIMPPKSTWFEPKLRSGLVVHAID